MPGSSDNPSKVEVTQLLKAWGTGDDKALDRLTPVVEQELHRLAHQGDQIGALLHQRDRFRRDHLFEAAREAPLSLAHGPAQGRGASTMTISGRPGPAGV